MGVLDKLEGGIEDAFDNASARVFKGTIEPAQIARRAEKQMKREKLVGTGRQYAPTLYTVLVSAKDDKRLFAFYPTMAAEVETYLLSRGADAGLTFDGRPLVRFIVDKKLRSGRFDVIAENVAAVIIDELRDEEAEYLGLKQKDDVMVEAVELMPVAVNNEHQSVSESPDSGLRAALRQVHSDLVQDSDILDSNNQEDHNQYIAGTVDADDAIVQVIESATGEAMLVDHQSGQSYLLDYTRMTIGRDLDNDIVLDDANASRRHAIFSQNALGNWKITDAGSTNGTLVNGKATGQMILRANDQLTIGVTVLEFIHNPVRTISEPRNNQSKGNQRRHFTRGSHD